MPVVLPDIKDQNGVVRVLGWTPPTNQHRKMRAERTSIRSFRAENQPDQPVIIPRADWKPVDFVTGYPLDLIEDQRQYGACTCATITGAATRQRHMRGQKYEKLSWCWLYDQVNGGRDSGSNIGEASRVAIQKGIPPMQSYNDCKFKAGRDPSGVLWYPEQDYVTFDDFDSIVTGVLMGILVQFPLDAGGRFEAFDGNGISTGRGSNPNHSVYVAGVAYIGGRWVLRMVNSWRTDWGPFRDGTCYVTEEQVNNCAEADDANGHITPLSPKQTTGSGIPDPVTAA